MSTWISRVLYTVCPALGLLLALAGCDEPANPFSAESMGFVQNGGSRPPTQISLVDGDIRVIAPKGYCIDRRSVRQGSDTGFALLARCDTLGASGRFGTHELAIVTVAISRRQPADTAGPTVAQLKRAASPAKVLGNRSGEGLVLLRLQSGAMKVPGVSSEHWRGAFALKGYLVGLGLYAPESSPMLDRTGAELLRDLTRRMRSASPTETRQAVPARSQRVATASNSG